MKATIAALLLERAAYKRRRLAKKAAMVTADDAPETTMREAAPEQAIPPRPRPRRSTHE